MAITGIGNNNVYEGTYAAQKNEAPKEAATKDTAPVQTGNTKNPGADNVSDYYSYLQKNYDCITTLQLFHKKNVIQDFLMYNKFANKKIRKKVILYDRLIIQRKNYNW